MVQIGEKLPEGAKCIKQRDQQNKNTLIMVKCYQATIVILSINREG
jgi:hypothetical protein